MYSLEINVFVDVCLCCKVESWSSFPVTEVFGPKLETSKRGNILINVLLRHVPVTIAVEKQ
jgi:hypothetical protein